MKNIVGYEEFVKESIILTKPNDLRPPLLNELMSDIPADADSVEEETFDTEILRTAMIAELDAINLYEQLSAKANNEKLKKLFLDIAKEEKTHVGELESFLLLLDKEQKKELDAGKKEVEK